MMKSKLVSKVLCYDRFTCGICTETLPWNQKFKTKKKRFQCSSSHPFCCDCISRYIKVKVEHDSTSAIKCPDTKCNVILDPLSCRSILSDETFVRWCRLLCENVVQSLTDNGSMRGKSAYCPYKHYSELILNECGLSNRITKTTCPNCKNLFCFQCLVPWKENHPCNIKLIQNSDRHFMELVRRNDWKCCPSCNRYIERISGCTLIMCRCKTRFCYFCGSKVTRMESCVCNRSAWNMYHGPEPVPELTNREVKMLLIGGTLFVVVICVIVVLVCYNQDNLG